MEVSETLFMGDRALVSATLNNAIKDALGFKRPKPPEFQITHVMKRREIKKCLKALQILCHLSNNNFRRAKALKIIVLAKLAKANAIVVTKESERLAWDARTFIDKDNKIFKFYAGLLDIDSTALAEKVIKLIRKHDGLLI